MKARDITCPHCGSTMSIVDDIPDLPAAKGFDCRTCHMMFVVAKLPSGIRAIACTRTGQATA